MNFRILLALVVAACLNTARAPAQTIIDTPAGRIRVANPDSPLGFGYYGGQIVQREDGHWVTVDYPIVVYVGKGGPAERAGLQLQDVLISVNGNDARVGNDAFNLKPGETRWVLRVRRGGTETELVLAKSDTAAARAQGTSHR